MSKGSPEIIAKRIMECAKSKTNPNGYFKHPVSGQRSDMCFTGGEPLLKSSQNASIEILEYFENISNIPRSVTYETNGTVDLNSSFTNFWQNKSSYELFFSISPKLFSVSGEKQIDAIFPEIVKQYFELSHRGQLKFVLGKENEQWEEMEEVINLFRKNGVEYPVYIMPVGSLEEDQKKLQRMLLK